MDKPKIVSSLFMGGFIRWKTSIERTKKSLKFTPVVIEVQIFDCVDDFVRLIVHFLLHLQQKLVDFEPFTIEVIEVLQTLFHISKSDEFKVLLWRRGLHFVAFTVLSQTESELFNLRLYFGNLINLEDFVHFVGAFNYFRQIQSVGDHL